MALSLPQAQILLLLDPSGVLLAALLGMDLVPVPSYAKADLPTPPSAGSGVMIYVPDATGAKVTGSLAFYNAGVGSWIDVTTGVAVA